MEKNLSKKKEVAEWMLKRLHKEKYLFQEVIVFEISQRFGDEYTYINNNGNLSISKSVLNEFKKLTEENVVWDRSEKMWRFRHQYDTPGKRQSDY